MRNCNKDATCSLHIKLTLTNTHKLNDEIKLVKARSKTSIA